MSFVVQRDIFSWPCLITRGNGTNATHPYLLFKLVVPPGTVGNWKWPNGRTPWNTYSPTSWKDRIEEASSWVYFHDSLMFPVFFLRQLWVSRFYHRCNSHTPYSCSTPSPSSWAFLEPAPDGELQIWAHTDQKKTCQNGRRNGVFHKWG